MKTILTYIGRRTSTNGKTVHAFIDKKEQQYWFSGVRYCIIGCNYFAEKTKETTTIPRTPQRADETETINDEWLAKDAGVDADIKRRRAAKRFKDNNPIRKELMPVLRRFTANLNYHETKSLIEFLVMECTTRKGKK